MLTKSEQEKINELVGTVSFPDLLAEVFTEEFTYEQIGDAYHYCHSQGAFRYIHDKDLQEKILRVAEKKAEELGVAIYDLNPQIVAKESGTNLRSYEVFSIIMNSTTKKRMGSFNQNERRCLVIAFPFMEKNRIYNIFYPRNPSNIYRTAYRLGLYRETEKTLDDCITVKELKDKLATFNDDDILQFEIMGVGGLYVIQDIKRQKRDTGKQKKLHVSLVDAKLHRSNF